MPQRIQGVYAKPIHATRFAHMKFQYETKLKKMNEIMDFAGTLDSIALKRKLDAMTSYYRAECRRGETKNKLIQMLRDENAELRIKLEKLNKLKPIKRAVK